MHLKIKKRTFLPLRYIRCVYPIWEASDRYAVLRYLNTDNHIVLDKRVKVSYTEYF